MLIRLGRYITGGFFLESEVLASFLALSDGSSFLLLSDGISKLRRP